MHDVKDYLDTDYDGNYHASYDSIVQSFGYSILMDEAIEDYQGDLVYALYDPLFNQWGFFVQGYGSCSGCDILEAMEVDNASLEEYRELQEGWYNDVHWYNSPEEMYNDIKAKDGDWYWYEDGYEQFVEKFKEVYVDGADA